MVESQTNTEQQDIPEQTEGQLDFKECCFALRKNLEKEKQATWMLFGHSAFAGEEKPNHGEMRANIMLAYRHLEDARMRFGKAIQAYDGGTSCYPR